MEDSVTNLKYRRFAFLSDKHLLAAFRIAKDKRKGLRPFFANPHDMIALRKEVEFRGLNQNYSY